MTQEFEQGVALARQGRLAEAEALFIKVSAAEPHNYAAHRMLALVRYQQGRFPPALEAIDAANAANPAAAEPWVLRGAILHRMERRDEAIASLDKATSLDPRDPRAWYNRGVVLGECGRFDQAVASFDQALAIQENPEVWTTRAGALLNLKRPADALASANRALELAPHYIPALCNRGMAHADLKHLREAVADLDHALAHAPAMAEAWVNRGTVLYELEEFAEALASYDRALQLQADNRAAWVNRGDVLLALKRYAEALENFDRARELAPGAAVSVKRAATFNYLNRLPEALAAADEALGSRGDYGEAHEMRGRVLLEMHRIEEGLEALRRSGENALQPGEDSESVQRHEAELRDHLRTHAVEAGERMSGPVVNCENAEVVARDWATKRPQIVVVDNLLTAEGLAALRRFCWTRDMWKRAYPGGYLGALPQTGFAAPLLAQLAEELRAVFPTVIGDHGLRLLWGFKYDSSLKGIGIHADQAAVNVNFWITPDDANLDPAGGGLKIWSATAPLGWNPEVYNRDEARIRAFLKDAGATSITVPYRANRAVIFDSDLFHETDAFSFKDGYLNRRMNLTLLFGRRNAHGT
ncbi:MAG: tetratricopeptide repeat protein [Rhodospirillaceae bacterium]